MEFIFILLQYIFLFFHFMRPNNLKFPFRTLQSSFYFNKEINLHLITQSFQNYLEITKKQPVETMQEKKNHQNMIENQKKLEDYNTIINVNQNSPYYKTTLKNPSEDIKNLLLDRFKLKKDKLIQSSSIYLNTGQVKKKKPLASDRTNLLSIIKQTSLQKLPNLQKHKRNSPQDRLSQTIDHDRSFNGTNFSTINSFKRSYNTIDIQSYQNSSYLKNNSYVKRTSLDNIKLPQNKFNSAQKNSKEVDKNHKNSQNISSFQLENQLKKKYLKSIVDRYFPVDQNQDQNKSKNYANKSILNIHRQKSKLNNPNISLPSINMSMDGKKSLENLKDRKNLQINEKSPKKETGLQKQKQKLHEIDHSLFKSNPSSVSLAQSYILQQISQDEEFEQNQVSINDFYENTAFYDRTGLFCTQSSTSLQLNGSMQDLYESTNVSKLQKADQNRSKQKRRKVYQNTSFVIYKVKTYSYQNLSQSNDIKVVSFQTEFRKYFKSEAALELKNREFKAKKMIEASNKNSSIFLWQQDSFDSGCIKIILNKVSTFLSQTPLSLSKLLYKISPYHTGSSTSFALIQPVISSKYQFSNFTQHSLLSNFQYALLKFIKNISQQLKPLSLSLINNKISLNNIFMIQDDRYAINEWSYSFFKQDYFIQTKKFEKRLEPILKNQAGEWFVTPQYLAPQILENLSYSSQQVVKYWKKIQGKKMQKAIVSQNDLFQYGNKADVWSLGLTILEIITLIPMWIGQKCIVQNKKSPKISPRKGLLHSQDRNLLKILTKQSYLRENLGKILRIQSQPYIIEDWLKNLINKMIDLDPKTRISFKEIISKLDEEQSRIKEKIKVVKK